mmetsp:Transcript_169194/g.325110  ORF Transcript_169194/g.325110 Transcript_169194/m.325110 type:complete len:249 (+) Transcript_169194:1029-1775(+)
MPFIRTGGQALSVIIWPRFAAKLRLPLKLCILMHISFRTINAVISWQLVGGQLGHDIILNKASWRALARRSKCCCIGSRKSLSRQLSRRVHLIVGSSSCAGDGTRQLQVIDLVGIRLVNAMSSQNLHRWVTSSTSLCLADACVRRGSCNRFRKHLSGGRSDTLKIFKFIIQCLQLRFEPALLLLLPALLSLAAQAAHCFLLGSDLSTQSQQSLICDLVNRCLRCHLQRISLVLLRCCGGLSRKLYLRC